MGRARERQIIFAGRPGPGGMPRGRGGGAATRSGPGRPEPDRDQAVRGARRAVLRGRGPAGEGGVGSAPGSARHGPGRSRRRPCEAAGQRRVTAPALVSESKGEGEVGRKVAGSIPIRCRPVVKAPRTRTSQFRVKRKVLTVRLTSREWPMVSS